MDGGIRIGTISSVDTETGMVSVVYQDRDGETTEQLPYATFNDEYKPPQIEAKVLVVHLSNGNGMGIVLGTYWNENNPAGNPGVYHKDFGGGAYLDYDGETLLIAAEQVRIASLSGEEEFQDFEISTILKELDVLKKRLEAVEKKI